MGKGLIIFDLDGTLADTVRDLVPALNRATALDGLPPIPLADVGHIVGQGAMAMIARAFEYHAQPLAPARHRELFDIFLAEYEAHICDKTVWFDGLTGALDALEADSWRFAVCTNKAEALARLLMDRLGQADRFVALTGGDTFDVKKPDPRHILKTAELAGVGGATIMVGDSVNDIEAARRAKVPSIGVTFGYTDTPMAQIGPDVLIEHFNQLPQAVESVMVGDAGIEPATPAV